MSQDQLPSREELAAVAAPANAPADAQMSFEEAMAAALAVTGAPMPTEVPPPLPAEPADATEQFAKDLAERQVSDPAKAGVVAELPVLDATKPAPPAPDASMKALMDREASIVAREAKFREVEADLRDISKKLDDYESARASFHANPIAFIRSLAPEIPLGALAESLWHEDLGPAAPKEYHLQKEVRETKASLQELRKQESLRAQRQAEEESRKNAEMALNQYVSGLQAAVPQLDATKHRLVKSLAAQNADMAIRMMLDAASIAAQEGRMLTPDQAAEAVEGYLSQFAPLYAPAPSPEAPVQPSAPQVKPVPSTLRNSSVTVQNSRAPTDPNDPRVLRRNALIEAGMNPEDPRFADWLKE